MDGRTYISVILPLRLEWEPCYYVSSDRESGEGYEIAVGDRVRVKFAFREYVGVVSAVGMTPDIEPEKIMPVTAVENGLERIAPEEIELWRRVAEYYLCSIGEVYKAAYPVTKINLEEARSAAAERASQRREKILSTMRDRIARIQAKIQKKTAMAEKSREGTKARLQHESGLERLYSELSAARKAIDEMTAQTSCQDASTKRPGCTSENHVNLSPAQSDAYEAVSAGIRGGKPVLLHGVTGSGKTEIYIRLAQQCLRERKNILYLVPEIALSRQLEDRLQGHFPGRLMVYHSGESAYGRRAIAERIRSCRKDNPDNYIVLGTRSSLFLPHNNLGLIIVDEEHDSSYKQDSPAPRYNGRDTALMLSVIHGCGIVLGSATPSLEELYNCQVGRHVHVELKERFHGSESSDVEIVDTTAERRKNGMIGNFSRKLISHIDKVLKERGQILVLRSRRAWSPALQCDSCGTIVKCPRCNVSLSYHKDNGSMICHCCGYRTGYTGRCSGCNGILHGLGAGTQKIEEELRTLFPEASVARLDSDTTHDRKYEAETIRRFSKGEIDILTGTQIISKGFDFSRLRLVAVIAADTLLGIQDFRADEKALHLLEQLRGRCGRRGEKGMFVIQTSQPDHPVYQHITHNDTESFSEQLMMERKDFSFPPYSRIIELSVRDTDQERCDRMAAALAAEAGRTACQVTGPYAPAIDRMADSHIRKIRISLRKDKRLKENKSGIYESVRRFEKKMKYDGHITIDVDPS